MVSGACFFRFIFERASGAFFSIFGAFWGVWGSQNGNQNRILKRFLRCFFRVRLGIDFLVIFSCFFRVQTLIFVRTASVLEHFHKIDGFLKSSKKTLILTPFSEAETAKNQEKTVLRN